jgi:hypothetical protein
METRDSANELRAVRLRHHMSVQSTLRSYDWTQTTVSSCEHLHLFLAGGQSNTVEQRVFVYDTSYSVRRRRKVTKFRRRYPQAAVTRKSTIHELLAKFRATGSMLDKKKTKKNASSDLRKLGHESCSLRRWPERVTALIRSSALGVKTCCTQQQNCFN